MGSSVGTHVYGKIKQGAYPESPSYHKKPPVGAASSREIK
jgi:hypothetical protein